MLGNHFIPTRRQVLHILNQMIKEGWLTRQQMTNEYGQFMVPKSALVRYKVLLAAMKEELDNKEEDKEDRELDLDTTDETDVD